MTNRFACSFALAMQIAVFAILASAAHTSIADTGAPLSRWLHEHAAPLLAQRLTEHPRLRGQQLTLISEPNELAQSLALQLETALLTHPGVLISRQRQNCETSTSRLELHVRILPNPDNNSHNTWRVQLDFRDPAEDLWIGGLGTHWIGTLQRPEKSALARFADSGHQADAQSLADTASVTASLQQQISCHMRRPDSLLHWPVRWQQIEQASELIAIQTGLAQWLGTTPQADASETTQLRLSVANDVAGQTLSLWAQKQSAQAATNSPRRQLVASVLLAPEKATTQASVGRYKPPNTSIGSQDTVLTPGNTHTHDEAQSRSLLDDFTIRGSGRRTASIRLRQDAFVLALRVQTDPASGRRILSPLNCAEPAKHRSAGEIRYRFNGNDSQHSQDPAVTPSLYLLATRSQSGVELLRPLLRQLPCDSSRRDHTGDHIGDQTRDWLRRFSLWQQDHEVEWRVTHFGEQPAALAATGRYAPNPK